MAGQFTGTKGPRDVTGVMQKPRHHVLPVRFRFDQDGRCPAARHPQRERQHLLHGGCGGDDLEAANCIVFPSTESLNFDPGVDRRQRLPRIQNNDGSREAVNAGNWGDIAGYRAPFPVLHDQASSPNLV